MSQQYHQQFKANIQSAELKFAQTASTLKMKITKKLTLLKHKVSKLAFSPSYRSGILDGTIRIQEAKSHEICKCYLDAYSL